MCLRYLVHLGCQVIADGHDGVSAHSLFLKCLELHLGVHAIKVRKLNTMSYHVGKIEGLGNGA